MKEKSAEEIISRKVGAEEAKGDLLEHSDLLWSQLDKRLEQKKALPGVHYYTLRVAAAVLVLFMLGLCLYPARKVNTIQETAAIQTVETNNQTLHEEASLVQRQVPDTTAVKALKKITLAHTSRRILHHKQEEINIQEEKEEGRPVKEYAGLYAMPQPLCADVSADQYPLCYQTL